MNDNRLELKHIAGYDLKTLEVVLSPTGVLNLDEEYPSGNSGLKFNITNILVGDDEIEIHNHKANWGVGFIKLEEILPILHPLSDLSSETLREFNFIRRPKSADNFEDISWGFVLYCYKNHIDFQDLIGKGLAISIHDIKQ